VAGAFEFCRDTPVEELTMPQLAAFLNVGVTSIYWYFKSKRELLDAMTEEAVASFYQGMPPLRGGSWEEMLRGFFVSFHALLSGDEIRCDLIVRRIGSHLGEDVSGSWARAGELIAALVAAGFPPSLARHAFFTLSVYTQGYLLAERTGRTAGPGGGAGAGAAAPAAVAGPGEGFEFGITNIIRGLRVVVPDGAEASAVALPAPGGGGRRPVTVIGTGFEAPPSGAGKTWRRHEEPPPVAVSMVTLPLYGTD
jgi:AcrR family transcriptional regulator